MLTISKQDVFKTIMIIWFVSTTGYVIYDIYAGYKIRGMQAAYQTGYQTSVSDLMKKISDNKCQPVEIQLNNTKTQLIDLSCMKQPEQQTQLTPTTSNNVSKK